MHCTDIARSLPKRATAPLSGLVAALLLSTAASAETLIVTDISTGDAAYKITVPLVEIVDGNMSEADVRGLFSADPTAALTSLGQLDATSLTIPEITISTEIAGQPGTQTMLTTYRGLELTDVEDGIAASAVLEASDVAVAGETETGEPMSFDVTMDVTSAENFNLGEMLAFYGLGEATETEDETFSLIYSNFFMNGAGLVIGDVTCAIGPASAAEFSARPLRSNLAEIQTLATEMEQAGESETPPDPESVRKFVEFYVDILTAYRSAPIRVEGFQCEGTGENDQPISITSGPLQMAAFEPGNYPASSMDDFDLSLDDGSFLKIGNFTFKNTDLSGPIALIESHEGDFTQAWFEENWRGLIPAFDGLSFADVAFDFPAPPEEGPAVPGDEDEDEMASEDDAAMRIASSFDLLDFSFGNYVNAIPAAIGFDLTGLVVELPDDTEPGSPIPMLKAQGFDTVNLSLGAGMKWNEAEQTVAVDRILVEVDKVGRIALSGTLGNATADLFSDDDATALKAATAMTLKDLRIQLDDDGMLDMAIAAGAADSKQPEAVFRTTMTGMAQGLTLAVLGNTEDALVAVQALGEFLAGAEPDLDLHLTAIDPAGLSLEELAKAGEDPTALNGKVTIEATASGAPEQSEPAEEPAAN
ncbi:hypothetical protein [Devosia sp.]|uniref:hypothetical protein n=1 Tax=Devosia sp. TaxID=1871048 RepID=UPI003A8D007A